MGKLEVIFRIRLAFPSICVAVSVPPAVLKFAETGNKVYVEAPQYGPTPADGPTWENSLMTLRVERECTEEEAKGFHLYSGNLEIERDAARGFWQLFEAIRESASSLSNTVFTYPVLPAETLLRNPLVREYEFELHYNGQRLAQAAQRRGIDAIEITEEWWGDAVKRLEEKDPVPIYRRFANDAFYFAEYDPPRGLIMACAAWEIALRYYLANVASERDAKYRSAFDLRDFGKLRRLAEVARGGPLFYDWMKQVDTEQASSDFEQTLARTTFRNYKQLIENLPQARNDLLHKGRADISPGAANDYALAVHAAIDWLFEEQESGCPTAEEQS